MIFEITNLYLIGTYGCWRQSTDILQKALLSKSALLVQSNSMWKQMTDPQNPDNVEKQMQMQPTTFCLHNKLLTQIVQDKPTRIHRTHFDWETQNTEQDNWYVAAVWIVCAR